MLGADHLDAVADRGYFNSPEILACEQADITVKMWDKRREFRQTTPESN
jgi:hypothetical protein